jgi:hypothetical protein
VRHDLSIEDCDQLGTTPANILEEEAALDRHGVQVQGKLSHALGFDDELSDLGLGELIDVGNPLVKYRLYAVPFDFVR